MFPLTSSRGPPSLTSYPGGRDLPSISSLQRPGSSMSISSMLGSDSERLSRDSAPPVPVVTAPISSPAFDTVSAFSPPQHTLEKDVMDYSLTKRSRTPDGYYNAQKKGTRAMRAYSGGTPPSMNNTSSGCSHEMYRFGPPLRAQPPSELSIFSQSAQTSGAPQPYNQQPRRTSMSGIPQRPNSQPFEHTAPPQDQNESRASRSGNNGPPMTHDSRQGLASTCVENERRIAGNRLIAEKRESHGRYVREEAERERGNISQVSSRSRFPASYQSQPIFGARDSDNQRKTHGSWNSQESRQRSPEAQRAAQAERPVAEMSNHGFRRYSTTSHSPFAAGSLRILQATRQIGGPQTQQEYATPSTLPTAVPFKENTDMDRLNYDPTRIGGDALYRTPASVVNEGPQRKRSEEGQQQQQQQQQQRGLLNVGADTIKRGGRISPLPQAVQGAQSQMSGPAGEPGIKSEFGRMFSGIGSGVGSAMPIAGIVGSGTPTPVGPSPAKRDDGAQRSPFRGGDEMIGVKVARVASRGGRKSRKIKDEENKIDSESGEGRGTPHVVSARGGKKSKHSHHHHVYQHGHQHGHHHHHHHHHKPDDDMSSPLPTQPFNTPFNSFNAIRRTVTPIQAPSVTSSPANIHHHHHHHHHHTSKATPAISAPAFRKPTITILSQPLLASVSHLPRHHLGSTLYSPKIQIPSSIKSHEEARFGYATTPSPLPRFQGKENCTYTVRVPRFYLGRDQREELCQRRAVWGTGVYTDDSDPLAAVIHSGWIRGQWGRDVDVSMLDLCINDATSTSTKLAKPAQESQSILTAPPRIGPMAPIAGKDLHITLLVLPQLQNYASTVAYGMKSRSWGGNHDGMSFKIEKIAWVDEGIGKAEERGGEARRKRLRAMLETRTMTTGRGLQLRVAWPSTTNVMPAEVAAA
ncbi:MAG: hypothetical protein M1830_010352 [Pleopsidium flavum]|nr:MAG: hypothetical protein M1830_010352 [Pleopsidium flavum]